MPDMPDSGISFWVIAFPMVVLPKIRAWYPCCQRTAQAELARWRPVWSRSSMVKRCQKHPPTESFWRHLFSPCLAAAWGLWTMFSDCSHIYSVSRNVLTWSCSKSCIVSVGKCTSGEQKAFAGAASSVALSFLAAQTWNWSLCDTHQAPKEPRTSQALHGQTLSSSARCTVVACSKCMELLQMGFMWLYVTSHLWHQGYTFVRSRWSSIAVCTRYCFGEFPTMDPGEQTHWFYSKQWTDIPLLVPFWSLHLSSVAHLLHIFFAC